MMTIDVVERSQDRSLSTRVHWVGLFVLLGLIVLDGAPALNDPLAGHHDHRMNETASIARNFAEGRFNLLYPAIDWSGSNVGYIEEAFQAYTIGVALLYRLGAPPNVTGRTLSLLMYVAAAFLLFLLVRDLFGSRAALFAVFFMAVAPIGRFYKTAFQPDAMVVLLSVAGLLLMLRWSMGKSSWALWGSAGCIALASVMKPTNLYLGLPLAYLAWRAYGWRFLRRADLWVFAALVFAATAGWYWHAHQLWIEYGNTAGIWGQGFDKLGTLSLWLDPYLYRTMLLRLILLVATVVGFPLLVVAMWPRVANGQWLFHFWLAGLAVSVMLSATSQLVHDYYQLQVVACVAALMGVSADYLWRRNATDRAVPLARWFRPAIAVLLAVGMWLLSTRTTERRLFYHVSDEVPRTQFVDLVRRNTADESLVIIGTQFRRGPGEADEQCCRHREPDGRFFGHEPIELYQSGRRGWTVHVEDWTIETLEYLKAKGASHFGTWYADGIGERGEFIKTVRERYTVIHDSPAILLVRLGE